ncbi:MAG TPA: cupin domain-containing protein [Gammaproteobacteria bacterium]
MKISSLKTIQSGPVSHNPAIKKQQMLGTNELDHLIQFSQAVFPAGEIAGAHSHPDMNEVFFILSGTGQMRIDDKTIELEPGMCITVEAGEAHEIENTDEADLVINYFALPTN